MPRAKASHVDTEKIFDAKVGGLLATAVTKLHPDSGNTHDKVLTIPSAPLDRAEIEKAFFQYGTYLELIGGDVSVEQTQVFEFPKRKEASDV